MHVPLIWWHCSLSKHFPQGRLQFCPYTPPEHAVKSCKSDVIAFYVRFRQWTFCVNVIEKWKWNSQMIWQCSLHVITRRYWSVFLKNESAVFKILLKKKTTFKTSACKNYFWGNKRNEILIFFFLNERFRIFQNNLFLM